MVYETINSFFSVFKHSIYANGYEPNWRNTGNRRRGKICLTLCSFSDIDEDYNKKKLLLTSELLVLAWEAKQKASRSKIYPFWENNVAFTTGLLNYRLSSCREKILVSSFESTRKLSVW